MNKHKPFLKWAGGKFRCLETIIPNLPSGNRLIEPFAGSGAVFINTDYANYLIAEQNNDLINLYKQLQKRGQTFIDYCQTLFTENNNVAKAFYPLRQEFNACQFNKRRAALFIYLNRHGYNGLCRYNQSGGFNVPFGDTNPYFPYEEMLYFYHKSQGVIFLQQDFRKTFAAARSGDVIYCDPPYIPLSKSASFTKYTHKKFTEADHIELAQLATHAASRGITVLISNHDTPFTRQHYKQGRLLSFPVSRFISCKAIERTPVCELLAIFAG